MKAKSDIQLDGTVLFKPSSTLVVPAVEGIYLIHDLRGTGYIGRSNNIRKRFDHHMRRPWNPRLSAFLRTALGPLQLSWITTNDSHTLEPFLVRLLDPAANRIRFLSTGSKNQG